MELVWRYIGRDVMYFTMIAGYAVIALVWVLPFIQGLLVHEKKAWLTKLAANSADEDSKKVFENTLEQYNADNNTHPFYQLFKFKLGLTGALLIIGAIMLLFSDLIVDQEVIVFLPLVFGSLLFGVYKILFADSGVWKEIGIGALFVGFSSTFMGVFPTFELDFMRPDIVLYIILGLGLFLYKTFKSIAVTFVYLTLVISSSTSQSFGGSEWLMFLNLVPWFFLAAIFYLWIPRLETAKTNGVVDLLFGILVAFAAIILTTASTANVGLGPLAIGVVLTLLYVISKAYFSKGVWLISKPIQLMVSAMVILMVVLTSEGNIMAGVNATYEVFTIWSLSKVFAFAVIAGLGYLAYVIYDKMDESKAEIDNLILLFPPFFIVAAWFGDWGGSYLVLAYALVLGFTYLSKGIENKDELFVVLGSTILIASVYNKLSQFISGKWFTSQYTIGLFLILLGVGLIAFMMYLKSQWNVTKENAESLATANSAETELS